MNKFLLPIAGIVLLFAACSKVATPLLPTSVVQPITDSGANFKDSIYTANTVPAPQQRSVLIEEFTGASCPKAPGGNQVLAAIETADPGRLNVISMHIFNYPQSYPEVGATYDFRTQDGTGIVNFIYGGIDAMPSAGVDRISYNNILLMDKSDWPAVVNARIAVATQASLNVTSTYNATTAIASIKVTVAYTAIDTSKERLNVVITEDSLIDKQEDVTAAGGVDTNYVFNNVLRDYVSSLYTGDELMNSYNSKPAGITDVRTYTYTVPAATTSKGNQVWVPAHCHVVAFLTYTSDNSVIQSASCKLVGP